jgi:hypothetical protein
MEVYGFYIYERMHRTHTQCADELVKELRHIVYEVNDPLTYIPDIPKIREKGKELLERIRHCLGDEEKGDDHHEQKGDDHGHHHLPKEVTVVCVS